MSWTDLIDTAPRCGCGIPSSDCSGAEPVARITITQMPDIGYTPFQRKDFLPPKSYAVSNVCGDSDGVSVIRCRDLTVAAVALKSQNRATEANRRRRLANKPPNQTPKGALIAQVDDLRSIRTAGRPHAQAVFVYEDPTLVEPEHAVIRMSVDVAEDEVGVVLAAVRAAFNRDETALGPD